MKMFTRRMTVVLFSIATMLAACQRDLQETVADTDAPSKPAAISKAEVDKLRAAASERLLLLSLLTMDVFADNPALLTSYRQQINLLRQSDKDGAVYMSDILKASNGVPVEFARAYREEILKRFRSEDFWGKERVQNILKTLKGQIAARAGAQLVTSTTDMGPQSTFEDAVVLMPHMGTYIYFPFAEQFNAQPAVAPYYVYDPGDDDVTSVIGYRTIGGVTSTFSIPADDIWAIANPTIVLRFDDMIAGDVLDGYTATSTCDLNNIFTGLCGPLLPTPPPPPPTPANSCLPLAYDIQPSFEHDSMNYRYLVTALIPRVRLLENVRKGFWTGKNNLAFYRGYATIAIPTNAWMAGAAKDSSRQMFTMDIKREDGKDKKWKDANAVWNYNWKQEQRDNFMAFTIVKSWLHFDPVTIGYNLKLGIKWDTATSLFVPIAEATYNMNASMDLGRVRERKKGEANIDRVSLLSNAVTDHFSRGTAHSHGLAETHPYAIRPLGDQLEFYFKPRVCY